MAARKQAAEPQPEPSAEVKVQSPTGAITIVPAALLEALLASGYTKK